MTLRDVLCTQENRVPGQFRVRAVDRRDSTFDDSGRNTPIPDWCGAGSETQQTRDKLTMFRQVVERVDTKAYFAPTHREALGFALRAGAYTKKGSASRSNCRY